MPLSLQQNVGEVEAIDNELQFLRDKARSLGSRRNRLQAVNLFPMEILTRIFCAFAHQNGYELRNVLILSHVCQYWRDVVMNNPTLWATFILDTMCYYESRDIISEVLRRSQNASIRLRIDFSLWGDRAPNLSLKAALLVLGHLPRIQKISIAAGRYDTPKLLKLIGERPAPLLQKFKLWSCHDPYQVPDTLFNGVAPQLRRLTLCACQISPSNPLLPNITHLKLKLCLEGVSLRIMLPVLANLPQLQYLSIDEDDSEFTEEDLRITGRGRAHLPYLKKLYISGPIVFIIFLLNYLSFPASASVEVNDRQGQINEVFSRLFQTDAIQQQVATLRTLVIRDNTVTESFLIEGFRSKADLNPFLTWRTLDSSDLCLMSRSSTGRVDIRSQAISVLFAHGSLNSLETLYVYDQLPLVDWRVAFRRLPNVHTIVIDRYEPMLKILAALIPPRVDVTTEAPVGIVESLPVQEIALPKLSKLTFVLEGIMGKEDLRVRFFDLLNKCVSARHEAAARITEVTFALPSIDRKYPTEGLEAFVDRVVWRDDH